MNWIDEVIAGVKDTYFTECPFELAQSLEIQIVYLEKDNIFLKGDDGAYIRDLFDREVIFIKNDLTYRYEKFILTHELGHALLHTDVYTTSCNKRFLNRGKQEREATYFAFSFLNVKFDTVRYEGFSIDQMASDLHIPVKHLEEVCHGYYTAK